MATGSASPTGPPCSRCRGYDEETVFGVVEETLYEQMLTTSLGLQQPWGSSSLAVTVSHFLDDPQKNGSPDIKVGRSPGRSDQELCDLGRNRLIHGFFWDLPEQYFLASVDGRLRRPRSGWGACSAAAKSRRKVFNLWLLLDDRWAGDTAQVEPVR